MQAFKANQYHLNTELILIFPKEINWLKRFPIYMVANAKDAENIRVSKFLYSPCITSPITYNEADYNIRSDSIIFIKDLQKPKLPVPAHNPQYVDFEIIKKVLVISLFCLLRVLNGEANNLIERTAEEIKAELPMKKLLEEINPKQLLTHDSTHVRQLIKTLLKEN